MSCKIEKNGSKNIKRKRLAIFFVAGYSILRRIHSSPISSYIDCKRSEWDKATTAAVNA